MNHDINLKATNVFFKHQRATSTIVLHRGGARSSKSYSIAQSLALDWINHAKDGIKILIIRKTLPAAKNSVLQTFKDVCDSFGPWLTSQVKEEKKELNFWFGKGLIHFSGLDNVEKLKSSEWNIIWMEEMTDFTFEDFKQILLRISAPKIKGVKNRLIGSFNPIDENHWIKTKVVDNSSYNKDLDEIVSNYEDNPFLDESYINNIILPLLEQDANFARIYKDGEWGKLENLIYNNWEIIDKFPTNKILRIGIGVDWGYNAPMGVLKVGVDESTNPISVYEEELLYETGLTTDDLAARFPYLLPDYKKYPIYCDSANPEKIKTLKRHGIPAKPAKKGKHSVKNGIEVVQTTKTYVTKNSTNLISEKRTYSWKKKNEIVLDEPIDFHNHLMDPERYVLFTMLKGSNFRIRWFGK